MLEQVLSVSYQQYVIDDILLGIVKEKFGEDGSLEISQLALSTATAALSRFGVAVDEKVEAELTARIRHIENAMEPYNEEYIGEQLNLIEKAVNKTSSTVFMKTARKGLREGYLYRGDRIDAPLDLSDATGRLESILGQVN